MEYLNFLCENPIFERKHQGLYMYVVHGFVKKWVFRIRIGIELFCVRMCIYCICAKTVYLKLQLQVV